MDTVIVDSNAYTDAEWQEMFRTQPSIPVIHHLDGAPWKLCWKEEIGSTARKTDHGAAHAYMKPTEIGWQWAIWSAMHVFLHRGRHPSYHEAVDAILRFLTTIEADRVAEGYPIEQEGEITAMRLPQDVAGELATHLNPKTRTMLIELVSAICTTAAGEGAGTGIWYICNDIVDRINHAPPAPTDDQTESAKS